MQKVEKRAVLSAAMLVGVAAMFLNVSPVLAGAMVDKFGFSNAQLGNLVGVSLLASAIPCMTQVFWLRKISNWRRALYVLVLAATACSALSSMAEGYYSLLTCLALVGLAMGGVYGIAMTLIGDSSDPDRGFGQAQASQSLVGVTLLYAIPALILPVFGFSGAMLSLMLFYLSCVLVLQFIPSGGIRHLSHTTEAVSAGSEAGEDVAESSSLFQVSNLKLLFAVLSVWCLMLAQSSIWVFAERIGNTSGLSGAFIGMSLALAMLAGGFCAFVPALIGNGLGRSRPFSVAAGCFITAIVLFYVGGGELSYLVACVLVMSGFAIGAPYTYAQIAETDGGGAVIVALPAMVIISSALSPMIAGLLYVESPEPLFLFCGCMMGAALLCVMISERLLLASKKDVKLGDPIPLAAE